MDGDSSVIPIFLLNGWANRTRHKFLLSVKWKEFDTNLFAKFEVFAILFMKTATPFFPLPALSLHSNFKHQMEKKFISTNIRSLCVSFKFTIFINCTALFLSSVRADPIFSLYFIFYDTLEANHIKKCYSIAIHFLWNWL